MESLFDFMASPAYAVFVIVWLASWIVASIIVLKRKGEAVFLRAPKGARFAERGASGYASGFRAIGGARNALLVFVDGERVRVTGAFPFNLVFLTQIWGLDHDFQRRDIVRVERREGLFGGGLAITYRKNLDERRFTLKLRDPAAFERAISI